MLEAFYKHFAELFGRSGVLDHGNALQEILVGGLRISKREAELCERPITAAEIIEVK